MSDTFEIGAAFSYGIDKLTTHGGAILVAAYVLHQIVTQVSVQSLVANFLADTPSTVQPGQASPLAIDMPMSVSIGLLLLLMLVGLVLSVVAMRALYSDIDRIPTTDHTRRLARTVVVMFFVSIIYGLAVGIGTILFIIPGIFLAVSLIFAQVAVVIEDAGVIEAFQRSWSLTSGNRLQLFFLGFLVFVVAFVLGLVGMFVGFIPVIGDLVSAAVNAVMSLFSLAVLIGAYKQLAGDDGAGAGAGAGAAAGDRL